MIIISIEKEWIAVTDGWTRLGSKGAMKVKGTQAWHERSHETNHRKKVQF